MRYLLLAEEDDSVQKDHDRAPGEAMDWCVAMKDPHKAASHTHQSRCRHDPNATIPNHDEPATDPQSIHGLRETDQLIRHHDAQTDPPERDDDPSFNAFNVTDKPRLHKPL